MELIKRVFMAAALLTVLAPIMNVYAASDAQESRQVDDGEEETKEVTAQSSIARIVWHELSPEEQERTGNDLIKAVYRGKIDEVKRLLASGVPIDFVNKAGWTVWYSACAKGNTEMVNTLFELSARSYVIDRSKHEMDMMSSFMEAIENNNVDAVKALLKSDMPVNILDDENRTPLIMAACSGSPEMVNLLLKNKQIAERIDYQDTNGNTALMTAIAKSHQVALDYCDILIVRLKDNPSHIREQMREGIICAQKERDQLIQYKEEKVQLLLQKKADTEKVNSAGETALDLVMKNYSNSMNKVVGWNVGSERIERLLDAGFPDYMIDRFILAGINCGFTMGLEKGNVATKVELQKIVLEGDKVFGVVTSNQYDAEKYGFCLPQDIRLIIGDYVKFQDSFIDLIRAYKAPAVIDVREIGDDQEDEGEEDSISTKAERSSRCVLS